MTQVIPTIPTSPSRTLTNPKPSLLHCAILPFRILQICGFFPLCVKSRGDSTTPPVITTPPWFQSPSTIWLFTLLFSTIFSIFITPFVQVGVYTKSVTEFIPTGRTTFFAINVCWLACSICGPFISRIVILCGRKSFVPFWDNYCHLIYKIKNCGNIEPQISQHVKWVRRRFITHATLQVALSIAHYLVSLMYATSSDKFTLVFSFLAASYQTLSLAMAGFLTFFSLHALIYFVTTYEFCVTQLLSKLQEERRLGPHLWSQYNIWNTVQLYMQLEEHVRDFSNLFKTLLNIFVIYSLGYLLYFMYFIFLLVAMNDYMFNSLNVIQLIVFNWYICWLASSASGLEEKSRIFCVTVKYVQLEGLGANWQRQKVEGQVDNLVSF